MIDLPRLWPKGLANFQYGALQDELKDVGQQFEAYMYRDEFTGQQHVLWRTVAAGTFGGRRTALSRGGGVLDALAIHGKLVTSSVAEDPASGNPTWSSFQESGQVLTYPPRILMKNDASCGMHALNTDSCFNLRSIRVLADRGCYCIVDDCPDG